MLALCAGCAIASGQEKRAPKTVEGARSAKTEGREHDALTGSEDLGWRVSRGLAFSPEVRMAEAEARRAQAALELARRKVTREIVKDYYREKELEQLNAQLVKRVARERALYAQGTRSGAELEEAQQRLRAVTSELQELRWRVQGLAGIRKRDAEMIHGVRLGVPYVANVPGSTPKRRAPRAEPPREVEPQPEDPRLAALQELLGKEMDIDTRALRKPDHPQEDPTPLEQVLEGLFAGTSFRVAFLQGPPDLREEVLTKDLQMKASRRVFLTLLADQHRVAFVLRPYGVLVIPSHAATGYDAPQVPEPRRRSPRRR